MFQTACSPYVHDINNARLTVCMGASYNKNFHSFISINFQILLALVSLVSEVYTLVSVLLLPCMIYKGAPSKLLNLVLDSRIQ